MEKKKKQKKQGYLFQMGNVQNQRYMKNSLGFIRTAYGRPKVQSLSQFGQTCHITRGEEMGENKITNNNR